MLALTSSTLDLKWNIFSEIKVLTTILNLSVFTFALVEQCRSYSPVYIIFLGWTRQAHVNSYTVLIHYIDNQVCLCLWHFYKLPGLIHSARCAAWLLVILYAFVKHSRSTSLPFSAYPSKTELSNNRSLSLVHGHIVILSLILSYVSTKFNNCHTWYKLEAPVGGMQDTHWWFFFLLFVMGITRKSTWLAAQSRGDSLLSTELQQSELGLMQENVLLK